MNLWRFLGLSWLSQLKQHWKAINNSRFSFSRLFCVLLVKGRGSGDMRSPHSLHSRTPNTATTRPLCCVWSRKLTGLWNQTAGIWSPHVTSLTLEWNSHWATSYAKDHINHVSPITIITTDFKNKKRHFWVIFYHLISGKHAWERKIHQWSKSVNPEQVQWAWKLLAFRTLTPPLTHLYLWATEHHSWSNPGGFISQR